VGELSVLGRWTVDGLHPQHRLVSRSSSVHSVTYFMSFNDMLLVKTCMFFWHSGSALSV